MNMLTNLKRVFHFAFIDFYRNKGMSVAAIFVLTITMLLVTGLFFMRGVSNCLVETIQNKIDIAAYFKADTEEKDILTVKEEILKDSPDIKSIKYVSREEALNDFIEKHKDNNTFLKSLTEVGENPFLASLNIITNGSTAQYEQVSNTLQKDEYDTFIEKVDFSEKKGTIEKIFSITSNINKFGLILGAVLVLVAVSVVFNTIKLIIESSKDEIATMKIVGASTWLIKAPFIIQGAIFGAIAFTTCLLVTLAVTYFLSPGLSVIMPGFILFEYFILNLWMIILIQLGFGVGLGIASSFIVVRKYLKV